MKIFQAINKKYQGKETVFASIPIFCMHCLEQKTFSEMKVSTGLIDVCKKCYPSFIKLKKKNFIRKNKNKSVQQEEWIIGERE